MFLTRKIGSFLRGKATRGQVFTAAVLAGLLGFIPGFFLPGKLGVGFAQAPGLILSLFFLVLVLNANFGVFGLVTLVAKLLSFVTLPLAAAIGDWLLATMPGLFKSMANGKVTAWFGLEHPATRGGLVLGLLFGIASGLFFVQALTRFRRHMANLEQNSDRYAAASQKKSLRFLTWLMFGKGKSGKVTWQELAEGQKKALPVRLAGVVLVVLIAGGLWAFQSMWSTPMLTNGVQSGLLAANGATVDVEKAELDMANGTLRIHKLAITDASALDKNAFSADLLEARLDTSALLQRRWVIDELRASGAATGQKRATPGVLTKPAEPPPPPPPAGTKTIEDYLKDYELWKGRIQQVRDWITKLTGSDQKAPAERTPEDKKKQRDIDVATLGYALLADDSLLENLPALLIRKITIDGIASAELGEAVDLHMTNFSTNAWLLAEPPHISVKTASGKLDLGLTGPSKGAQGAGIDLTMKGLSVDALFAQFKLGGAPPLRGGTIDLSTKGMLQTHLGQETTCELPLNVTLRDTMFALAGAKETKVEQLLLPIAIGGPVTRPTVGIQDKALADALTAAGKAELAGFVNAQAGKLLGGAVPGLGNVLDANKSVGENVDAAKAKLEEEAKKQADAAKKAAEDAAKKAAADAAKKAAEKGLKGLLPGGGKKQ